MATVEISTLEVLVFKKLALINYALAKSLKDKGAAAEQMAMTKVLNEFVIRADMSVKTSK